MTPQLADTLAFAACLAGAAAPLLLLLPRRRRSDFADLIAPFNKKEAEAARRGDTRGVGKARRQRREAVHASLRRAA